MLWSGFLGPSPITIMGSRMRWAANADQKVLLTQACFCFKYWRNQSFASVKDMISILLGLFGDNSCCRLLQEQFNFLIVTVRVTLRLLTTSVGNPHQCKHVKALDRFEAVRRVLLYYLRETSCCTGANPAGFVCSSSRVWMQSNLWDNFEKKDNLKRVR